MATTISTTTGPFLALYIAERFSFEMLFAVAALVNKVTPARVAGSPAHGVTRGVKAVVPLGHRIWHNQSRNGRVRALSLGCRPPLVCR